jgi:hypothetical protein
MSYIIKSTSPFVSIKLTDIGRQQLALGQLNFSNWAIGDSEINYDREQIVDADTTTYSATSIIMRPFDKQPDIKSFITSSNSANNLQPINSSNMNVVKAIVNNEATERGFFDDNNGTAFTISLDTTLTPTNQAVLNTNLTGGTSLTLTSTTSISVGDYIMLKLVNDSYSSITVTNTTQPIPNLWFKIQSINGLKITVDRTLPNYSSDTATSRIIVYKSGEVYNTIATGNTTSYWDTGTLSFNSSVNVTCHDVPVWNMNNVWSENLAGMVTSTLYEDFTKFGSYDYLGSKNPYFEYLAESTATTTTNFNCNGPGISYPDDISKSLSIIHYTNNAISSLYGEFLFVDATNDKVVKIHLPNLMYHRRGYSTGVGVKMGMTFIASGATQLLGNSEIEYIDLVEDASLISSASTTQLVVGKVFPQLKMVVIHDDEIIGAISYKSNRNWTLPPLAANIISPSGGTSTGILAANKTMYLTYTLETDNTILLSDSLPCQNYIKITNNTSSAKDVSFRISETDLLPYMRKIELGSYDGLGFFATNFKVLYQIVDNESIRPKSSDWKVYDYTSSNITSVNGETINPLLLEQQNTTSLDFVIDLIKDASATQFSLYSKLNMAPNNQPSYLQFGDERFFYGNLQTFIGATIYKTIFDVRINSAEFSTTSNPTRSKDTANALPNIKVSEVGIYDSAKNLVCIGKLSQPVPLINGNTIMLELSIDF